MAIAPLDGAPQPTIRIRREIVSPDIVEEYAGLGTATVYEANGRRGSMDPAIKPIFSGMRIRGVALTVQAPPGDNLMIHKAIDIARPGDVIVVDSGGHVAGAWGELMAVAARARGVAGLVIDGYARDGDEIRLLDFPVFSRGLCIRAVDKLALGSVNHPITCGGVVVNPGDLVVGDDDGVTIVAFDDAGVTLGNARAREELEALRRQQYAHGETAWSLHEYGPVAIAAGMTEEVE